ncbi:MAG: sodium:calcium antiporter [Bacillaceae bacterium]|nr:sodium:calcium antiporter [Bacillaceae bacterium]
MVYVYFIISVIATIIIATKLSKYADAISKKTTFGGAFLGAILLGGATSLPEITTSYTAAIIHNPDLILGNILGSNLFNLLTLAFLNVYFIKKRIFQFRTKEHLYAALLGLFLTVYLLFGLYIKSDIQIWGVGLDSILLLVGYGFGIWLLAKIPNDQQAQEETKQEPNSEVVQSTSLRSTMVKFVISCLLIMFFGTILTVTGDEIAVITGLGSSFVGMFLIAVTTSLPEVVSCIVAVRLGNPSLAIGSVLGSNLFNLFVLGSSDIFYRSGLLLASVDIFHYLSTITLIIMNIIIVIVLARRTHGTPKYVWVSIAVIGLYILNSLYMFFKPF